MRGVAPAESILSLPFVGWVQTALPVFQRLPGRLTNSLAAITRAKRDSALLG